jgi:glycerol uptake operon antiterminator
VRKATGSGGVARASEGSIIERLSSFPVGAAIKRETDLPDALASRVGAIFILRANGLELADMLRRVHAAGKLAAVHLDLIDGLGPDRSGVSWLARSGVDAVISSHGQAIRAVRAEGLVAIQRLLLLQEDSIDSGLAAIERGKPDVVELLPGVILPNVRDLLASRLQVPLLAGGFIRTRRQAEAALQAGAFAVTTSSSDLWN